VVATLKEIKFYDLITGKLNRVIRGVLSNPEDDISVF